MTTHYIEIKVRGSKKRPTSKVLNDVMRFVHMSLAHIGAGKVGVSFPKQDEYLGDTLRLHGPESELLKFQLFNLESIQGVTYQPVKVAPETSEHACFKRKQPSYTNAKLKRGLKSGHITDRKLYIQKIFTEQLRLPFFQVKSGSSGQMVTVHVNQSPIDKPIVGEFNAYGLSIKEGGATVPMF